MTLKIDLRPIGRFIIEVSEIYSVFGIGGEIILMLIFALVVIL